MAVNTSTEKQKNVRNPGGNDYTNNFKEEKE